jgi:pentatricopeptide repeat protein
MLRFMRLRKMSPSHKTFHALLAGCAREGMPDVGVALYVEMRAGGHLPETRGGSALVATLSQAGRLLAALLVLRDMAACASGGTVMLDRSLAALVSSSSSSSSSPSSSLSSSSSLPQNGATTLGAMAAGQPVDAAASAQLRRVLQTLPALELSPGADVDVLAALDATPAAAQPTAAPGGRTAGRAAGRGAARRAPSGRQVLRKSDMLPSMEAVAALVAALCLAREGELAHTLYLQIRSQGTPALCMLVLRSSRMFELLLEWHCRSGRVHDALAVFDDWKAARDLLAQRPAADCGANARPPKLSNVTLAFLEASCHAHADSEDVKWRVYDVCAQMRQQQEDARSAKLLHPAKGSHHVKEEA